VERLQSVQNVAARSDHIASAPSATLATSAPVHPLQGGHVRPPVVVWRFTIVPANDCRPVADARE